MQDYEKDLEANLEDLLNQMKSGRYRAPRVRRHYIAKADGSRRLPGIPTLEDKVAQRAIVMLVEPIYEGAFRSSSYGFRPGRSAHDALDAVLEATFRNRLCRVIDYNRRGASMCWKNPDRDRFPAAVSVILGTLCRRRGSPSMARSQARAVRDRGRRNTQLGHPRQRTEIMVRLHQVAEAGLVRRCHDVDRHLRKNRHRLPVLTAPVAERQEHVQNRGQLVAGVRKRPENASVLALNPSLLRISPVSRMR